MEAQMAYSALSQHQNVQFPTELADVRGFEVRTRDDDKVGRVKDLICSADGQIRYLDVDLGGFFNTRHVALPVGAAQVDRERDVVWVTGMTKEQIKALPDYTGDASLIDDRYEGQVRGASGAPAGTDADLYDQGRFYADRGGERAREARVVLSAEQLSVGTRQVPAGEVGIRKTVETERVRQSVTLMREEVTIERHPVSADAASRGDLTLGADVIRIPLMREEAVVDKRVVPVEEVVVRTNTVTEHQTVEDTVRHERLSTEGLEQQRGLTGGALTGGGLAVSGLAASRLAGSGRNAGLADRDAGLSGAQDRGTDSGLLDRAADTLDDLKDRVDGNPASRPGPDATDRRL
jgi:uncharacterized protein (TIGR02271 family)